LKLIWDENSSFLFVGFRTRNISKRRSHYKLLDHIQQASDKQKDIAEDGKAYYDYRNGIYY